MLLTQSLFSVSPTIMGKKYSPKHNKASYFDIMYEKSRLSSTSRSTRNRKLLGVVDYNSCSPTYFSTCAHQQSLGSESLPLEAQHGSGIGIDNFFEGKNIFITGATGLLGKGTYVDIFMLEH